MNAEQLNALVMGQIKQAITETPSRDAELRLLRIMTPVLPSLELAALARSMLIDFVASVD